MRFLEKDLESIIWGHPSQCHDLGLEPAWAFVEDSQCVRWRQLQLGVFGVADLVSVCYNPNGMYMTITVLECKKNVVGMAAYVQAKRYMNALVIALDETITSVLRNHGTVNKQVILVGATAEKALDFHYLYSEDEECQAYTFDYGPSGIEFLEIESLLPAGYSAVRSFPALADAVGQMRISQDVGFARFKQDNPGTWQ